MLILESGHLENCVGKDPRAVAGTVGRIAGLTGTGCVGSEEEESMPWPLSSDSAESLELGGWQNVVPGAPSGRSRACPEVKVKKSGLDFMPECAGLILAAGHTVGSSGQLSFGTPGALTWEQRQWYTRSWRQVQRGWARKRCGPLGSPHIPQMLSFWQPDQFQTPLINGAEHFSIMAACSDLHVKSGPRWEKQRCQGQE